MPQGVVFMESGVQFDWEQCSEALALIRLGSRENSNFSLLQNLVSEASARYPQLRQLRFVNVPIPTSQLESWSYYLASAVDRAVALSTITKVLSRERCQRIRTERSWK